MLYRSFDGGWMNSATKLFYTWVRVLISNYGKASYQQQKAKSKF